MKKTLKRFYLYNVGIALLMMFWLAACGKKMPLPVVERNIDSFGANDTSYTELLPAWTASTLGFQGAMPFTPVDIAVGADGYIFVADSANDRIISLSKSGQVVNGAGMSNIASIPHPHGIAIDSKLNLLIVNGTNKVYVWNQYINYVGVSSVITGFGADSSFIFSDDPALIDSVKNVYTAYEDPDPNASFQGVAFGPARDNTVFLTDNGTQRIVKLGLFFGGGVRLSNGYIHPLFSAYFGSNVASFGSGAGTVDQPQGITSDGSGNIYFTQLGGNFLVQKLAPTGDTYNSAFTLYEHPIMDLNRFQGPLDIALGQNDAIFVLDTEAGVVHKFFNKGTTSGSLVGMGKTGLAVTTFSEAYSIAVDDEEVVYIAETGKHQIRRFRYSVSEGDLPVEQP